MAEARDRILVIDGDDDERTTLVEATLVPFGYDVRSTGRGDNGLAMIRGEPPDVMVLDLHLEGLSGRDIITAINAQGLDIPVIVIADEGGEKEALQAFRLGAHDYVVRPVREAELIQVIERALKATRLKRQREALLEELRQSGAMTKRHLDELKTLMTIGKAVAGLRNLNEIFDGIIRAAMQLTHAEAAGFLLKDEQSGNLILRAGHSLSRELEDRLGKLVEDDLASLVMSSRATYIAAGEGLRRFNPVQRDASAVIYAPLVVHDASIGVVWVANRRADFEVYMKDLMTALADYAAIAIVNARLFTTMHERTRQLEQQARQLAAAPAPAPPEAASTSSAAGGEAMSAAELAAALRPGLTSLLGNMNMFRRGELGQLPPALQAAVDVMHRQFQELVDTIDRITPPDTGGL